MAFLGAIAWDTWQKGCMPSSMVGKFSPYAASMDMAFQYVLKCVASILCWTAYCRCALIQLQLILRYSEIFWATFDCSMVLLGVCAYYRCCKSVLKCVASILCWTAYCRCALIQLQLILRYSEIFWATFDCSMVFVGCMCILPLLQECRSVPKCTLPPPLDSHVCITDVRG